VQRGSERYELTAQYRRRAPTLSRKTEHDALRHPDCVHAYQDSAPSPVSADNSRQPPTGWSSTPVQSPEQHPWSALGNAFPRRRTGAWAPWAAARAWHVPAPCIRPDPPSLPGMCLPSECSAHCPSRPGVFRIHACRPVLRTAGNL